MPLTCNFRRCGVPPVTPLAALSAAGAAGGGAAGGGAAGGAAVGGANVGGADGGGASGGGGRAAGAVATSATGVGGWLILRRPPMGSSAISPAISTELPFIRRRCRKLLNALLIDASMTWWAGKASPPTSNSTSQ